MRAVKIFCPKCKYVPSPSDFWVCEPACGWMWHTFDTCGVCPQCGKNWEDTQCPKCTDWSRHADWYHELIPAQQQSEVLTVAE